MKKSLPMVAVALVLGMGWIAPAFCEQAPNEAPVSATVSGVNFNVAATLAKDAETDAAFAKLNALRVTSAKDAGGKLIEGLVGKVLYYIPTKSASSVLSGETGKTLTITGKLFTGAGALLVEQVVVAEDEGWEAPNVTTITQKPVIEP